MAQITEANTTQIEYDYLNGMVTIYTTQIGVFNKIIKRVGRHNLLVKKDGHMDYEIMIPKDKVRGAHYITKIVNKN